MADLSPVLHGTGYFPWMTPADIEATRAAQGLIRPVGDPEKFAQAVETMPLSKNIEDRRDETKLYTDPIALMIRRYPFYFQR